MLLTGGTAESSWGRGCIKSKPKQRLCFGNGEYAIWLRISCGLERNAVAGASSFIFLPPRSPWSFLKKTMRSNFLKPMTKSRLYLLLTGKKIGSEQGREEPFSEFLLPTEQSPNSLFSKSWAVSASWDLVSFLSCPSPRSSSLHSSHPSAGHVFYSSVHLYMLFLLPEMA